MTYHLRDIRYNELKILLAYFVFLLSKCCINWIHPTSISLLQVTSLGSRQFAASWSELGNVHLWDMSQQLEAINDHRAMAAYMQNGEGAQPEFSFTGHAHEGFAMQWNPLVPGRMHLN